MSDFKKSPEFRKYVKTTYYVHVDGTPINFEEEEEEEEENGLTNETKEGGKDDKKSTSTRSRK